MNKLKAAEFIPPIAVGITASLLLTFTSLNPFVSIAVVVFVYSVGLFDGMLGAYKFWKEQ